MRGFKYIANKNSIVLLKKYFKHLSQDAPASLVVFLVALPLCLGIALGSGAPLFSGIIAGVSGGIVVGIASGSQLSVSGPAAGLTAIVAAGILKLPAYEVFILAVVIAGFFQLLLGFLKAGFLGDYVPNSVIKGMLSAIGLILILKQIPHLVGYDADFEGDESFMQADSENSFSEIFNAFKYIAPLALGIGLLSLLVQIVWDNILAKKIMALKQVPAPLIVVLLGVLINEIASVKGSGLIKDHMVNIPIASSGAEFLSFFTSPDFSAILNPQVWITGATLAIVASLETLLSIEAADALDPLKRATPTNRELKAQGLGNVVSGLLGGLPVTSVVVRTSANINAGASTKLSAVLHGGFLLVCVALIPGLLNKIPLSALAAVLIYTGFKLTKPSLYKAFFKRGYDQFIPFIATIIAILLSDLLIGIMIGMIVALFFILRSNFQTSVLMVNDKNNYLVRLKKDVSFLNKAILKTKLESLPEDCNLIIDAMRADFIDKDVIDVINDFLKHAHLRGIKVSVSKNQYKASHQLIGDQYDVLAD